MYEMPWNVKNEIPIGSAIDGTPSSPAPARPSALLSCVTAKTAYFHENSRPRFRTIAIHSVTRAPWSSPRSRKRPMSRPAT